MTTNPVPHGRSARKSGTPGTGGKRAPSPARTPGQKQSAQKQNVTRTGVIWTATAVALILLILLIVFILQNPRLVTVTFLGIEGSLTLGMALFIAAVAGGALVAIIGGLRIAQLRLGERRNRKG
jgi:uncharacterized integral membrane protein